MSVNLQVDTEYKQLVRPLTSEEYNNLKTDIQKDGKIYVPIIINKNNCILDGHHRYQIAQELSFKDIPIKTIYFDDKLDEKEFVIRCNLNRRQLNMVDKAFLANEIHKIEAERARLKQIAAGPSGKLGGRPKKPLGQKKPTPKKSKSKETIKTHSQNRSRSKAAKSHGISAETLRKYQMIMQSKYDDLKQKLDSKSISIGKAYKTLEKRKRDDGLLQAAQNIKTRQMQENKPKNESSYTIKHGDFLQLQKDIPDNSIDLIFTDPPYDSDSITAGVYIELAKMADRVLKPNGSLVTYLGQYALPEILAQILDNSKLRYWWIIAVKHTGRQSQMYQKKITVCWKPLLWFIKGDRLRDDLHEFIPDLIESEQPDKTKHEWAQSEVESKHVISKLTKRDDIILDPFMGSGTTGIACVSLARRFIGFEKDLTKFGVAALRLKEYGAI